MILPIEIIEFILSFNIQIYTIHEKTVESTTYENIILKPQRLDKTNSLFSGITISGLIKKITFMKDSRTQLKIECPQLYFLSFKRCRKTLFDPCEIQQLEFEQKNNKVIRHPAFFAHECLYIYNLI